MNGRSSKIILSVVALALLVTVNFSQRALTAERTRLKLTRVEAVESMPPAMAFTAVALGGFRGLISNALWIRLNDLQLDEKYFEMVQLSDWITKMQPHFVAVWVHQAWNLSYNISVKFPDPNDRWFWVYRGIELLRDEALKYNPNETLIYRELAWHFQHKMGQNLDNAHMTYKREWVMKMAELFGERGSPKWEELINPTTDEAKARAKLLAEKYKLDAKLLREGDEKYGPIEWRLLGVSRLEELEARAAHHAAPRDLPVHAARRPARPAHLRRGGQTVCRVRPQLGRDPDGQRRL